MAEAVDVPEARDDIEASGLLDGLEGRARAERAELVEWLLSKGFTRQQIAESFAPMLLATRRAIGDDGTLVSARQISERTGLNLQLLERMIRAVGLPRIDDPDAAVLPKSDAEAFANAQKFLELGITPDHVVLVLQVLAEGLTRAADVMRYAALAAVLTPGSTELETAKASEALV
ncbi:MAG: adenylate/guanylate cyclase domain-containing protein, partial [Actinomycetota bacterium]|nr:adenylate/guanylate cyclase domain-containing protein [Actinomycetota bacterium]